MDFKQQMVQAISRINEKNPYYTIIGFLVIVLCLDYFLIMQFQLKTLSALDTKLVDLKRDLESSQVDIQRFSAYQNQVNRLQEKFEKIDEKIKSKQDLPLILENISRLANRHGIKIEQIRPNMTLSKSVLKSNDGEYFSVPIDVQARSGYHEFGRFLNQMENEEIFLLVPEFSLVADSNSPVKHNVEITIHAIVFEKAGG